MRASPERRSRKKNRHPGQEGSRLFPYKAGFQNCCRYSKSHSGWCSRPASVHKLSGLADLITVRTRCCTALPTASPRFLVISAFSSSSPPMAPPSSTFQSTRYQVPRSTPQAKRSIFEGTAKCTPPEFEQVCSQLQQLCEIH